MRSVLGVHWRDWCWSWNSNTLATWCKELTHLKRPWCWERLRAGGEGDDKGWDGWMASPTQWTWVWVKSGSWWWTGGLACCGLWGHKELDMTEWMNWTELNWNASVKANESLWFLPQGPSGLTGDALPLEGPSSWPYKLPANVQACPRPAPCNSFHDDDAWLDLQPTSGGSWVQASYR